MKAGIGVPPRRSRAILRSHSRRDQRKGKGDISTTQTCAVDSSAGIEIALLGAAFAVHAAAQTAEAMVSGLRVAYLGGVLVELAGALIALIFIRDDSMEQRKR